MKMCFIFHYNRTTNKEFYFWRVKENEGEGDSISKILKSPIQNGGPNPHRKFQDSSSNINFENSGSPKCEKKDILDPFLAIFKNP